MFYLRGYTTPSELIKFKKVYRGRTRYWIYVCKDCYENAQILADKYGLETQQTLEYMREFLSIRQKEYLDIDEYIRSQSGETVAKKVRISFAKIHRSSTYYVVKKLLQGFGIKLYTQHGGKNNSYWVNKEDLPRAKKVIRDYYNGKQRYKKNCVDDFIRENA